MNARVPGYTGFIPSARAEDVCARTQAAVGRSAQAEQLRRREIRANSDTQKLPMTDEDKDPKKTLDFQGAKFADDHPMGRSKSAITRNHWVPTIPGYGGFIPAKDAESVIGGGMTATCRLAGRAIAERGLLQDRLLGSDGNRSADQYLELRHDENGVTPHRERVANHLRSHCGGKIPGYTGFIPRIHGESIFGAGHVAVNQMAADFCEDRAFNPSDHGKKCCAPQFPDKRRLRM